jgi:pseudouridine kinase
MLTFREEAPILVIGSAGLDIIGRAERDLHLGTSNPGRLRFSLGGVARNVAENLVRLGSDVALITAVGDDPQGEQLLTQARQAGINVDACLTVPGEHTGAYLAVLDEQGSKHLALDDMRVIENITPQHIRTYRSLFGEASAVFLDANLPIATLAAVMSAAGRARVPVIADPTSVSLATRLSPHLEGLYMITPNEAEASRLCPHPVAHADREQALDAARHLVSQGVEAAVVTMAEFGVAYATPQTSGLIPAVKTEVLDPTGAGDALTAAIIFALQNSIPIDEAVRLGASAAALTLRTTGSVVPNLSIEMLYDELR